jgi:uncharacterized protein
MSVVDRFRSWVRWLAPGWALAALCTLWSVALAAPPAPPAPTAHVSDQANVLSTAIRDSLDRRLVRYQQESGHQIVVWIGRTTGGVPIEDFAVEAFERWKIGDPELDDGLGVFVLVEDRAVRVEVGYGLEPTITDLLASRVIRGIMIPRIEQGDWNGAIVTGVEALVDTIEGTPGSLPADPGESSESTPPVREWSWWQIGALIIGIVLFMVLMATHPRLALGLLFMIGHGALGGRGRESGGGFSGFGGRSGGGGATGHW